MPGHAFMNNLLIAGVLGIEGAMLPSCASLTDCPAAEVVAQRRAAEEAGEQAPTADIEAPFHPARWVDAGTLVSTGRPNIEIDVADDFDYVGVTRYELLGEVSAEAFIFADADGEGFINRQLTFIFEGALPDSDFTYRYSGDDTERLGRHDYIADTFFFWGMDEAIRAEPGRDTAIINRFLAERGYEQPDDGLIQRFVRVVTEDRRHEFIIAYMEDLGDLGYTRDELEEGGVANELVPDISASLRDRALASFTVMREARPEALKRPGAELDTTPETFTDPDSQNNQPDDEPSEPDNNGEPSNVSQAP